MNAKIDIKTPAGQSLEGFPVNRDIGEFPYLTAVGEVLINSYQFVKYRVPRLHSGDKITIEIL